MDNLYEVLRIDSSADEREIKRAYIQMIKKYPPEKAPEEFKKIREAYERLSNNLSRAEYDAFSEYEDRINKYSELAQKAMQQQDYATAIKEYKRILIIEPNLAYIKNQLGVALANSGQLDLAIKQFEQLIIIDESNPTYYNNLGKIYHSKRDYLKAEEMFLKAYSIDPISDNVVISLSELYMEMREYEKGIAFLRSCIGKHVGEGFQDFIYYFEIIKMHLECKEVNEIKKVVDEIRANMPDEQETRSYVAWKLGRLAYEVYNAEGYDIASELSKYALSIDETREEIRLLYENSTQREGSKNSYEQFVKDERIVSPIKGPVFFDLIRDSYEGDLENMKRQNFEAINSYLSIEPAKVIDSIDLIKEEYNEFYELRIEIYSDIYKVATQRKKIVIAYERLKKNEQIHSKIKKLVACLVFQNLSTREGKSYYASCMQELKTVPRELICNNIWLLKQSYQTLYDLNPKIFSTLEKYAIKEETSTKTRTNKLTKIMKIFKHSS